MRTMIAVIAAAVFACTPEMAPQDEPSAGIAAVAATTVTACTGYNDTLEHFDFALSEGQQVAIAGTAVFVGLTGTHGWLEVDALNASGQTIAMLKWWYFAIGTTTDLTYLTTAAPAGTVAGRVYREAYCASLPQRPGDLTTYDFTVAAQ